MRYALTKLHHSLGHDPEKIDSHTTLIIRAVTFQLKPHSGNLIYKFFCLIILR